MNTGVTGLTQRTESKMAYKLNSKKVFDISTEKGIKRAEKYQKNLYKKFDNVKIEPTGFNKVALSGVSK